MSQLILIKKTVSQQFNYWWNEDKGRWEGLRINATPMDEATAAKSMAHFNAYEKEISFENL